MTLYNTLIGIGLTVVSTLIDLAADIRGCNTRIELAAVKGTSKCGGGKESEEGDEGGELHCDCGFCWVGSLLKGRCVIKRMTE